MEENLVSVITPVYNCEKYIDETIRSVIEQTYENWEMILIDDMSTDNSCKIIEKYQERDIRIKLVKLNENCGAACARNKAMQLSKGRFLAFLDGDDIWMPNKLEVQIEKMLQNDSAISHSNYEVISDDSKSLDKIIKVPKSLTYDQYLRNTIIQTVTVVLDKKYVGDIRMPNIKMRQDFATWLSILKLGYNALGIDQTLGKYRKTNDSLSSNKFKAAKKTWYVYREVENLSFIKSIYCFNGYAYNACKKRIYTNHYKKKLINKKEDTNENNMYIS